MSPVASHANMPESYEVDVPELMPAQEQQFWSEEAAEMLQDSVDKIFSDGKTSLLGLDFSFTIADPSVPECPLIGCSTGFTTLCGYGMDDIVGQNCRFLVDPVPAHLIDQKTRDHTKEFCRAVHNGAEWMPPTDYPFAPVDKPLESFVCMQTNARKDGTLFNNLFYMKVFELGTELGEETPYIVALQADLKEGKEDLVALANVLGELDEKMGKVQDELSAIFFCECALSRQLFKPRRQISAF